MEETATGCLVATRLKLLEELLRSLEGGSGLSLDEWRQAAQDARRSDRRSSLRRDFRKQVRAAKGAWRPVRDLLNRNGGVLGDLELASGAYYWTVRHAAPPNCARGREWPGGTLTGLTRVRVCWVLCSSCVESARTVVLAMLEKQRALMPMSDVVRAVERAATFGSKDPRVYNVDGTLKEAAYKVLGALERPRSKLAGVAKAAGFSKEESVREVTPAMRELKWIRRSRDGMWTRTKAGDAALAEAKK